MVVYIEFIFLVNFIADITLSAITLRALRFSPKIWRLALVSVVGAVASVLYVYHPVGLLLKLLLSVIMVLLLHRWRNLKSFLKGILVFYLISALYAGGAMFFDSLGVSEIELGGVTVDISPVVTAIAFVALTLVAEGAFGAFYKRRSVATRLYSIEVGCNGNKVKTEGFYDTGNTMQENGEPVVVVSSALQKKLKAQVDGTLEVMTVTGIRLLPRINLTVKIYYGGSKNKLYKAQGVISDRPLKAPVILNSEFEEEL